MLNLLLFSEAKIELKMKKILLIVSIIITEHLFAQITLKQCIESGLKNKANIKSSKLEVFLANLKIIENKAKYLPQIALAYDYRYNPIIPSQIVPVGQFSPIATNDTRAIQFGINWQQNAGVTLYQPLIELAIQSRIKESKLSELISDIDLQKAETDLSYEIIKTYSRIISFGFQLEEAVSDSIRSFQSYKIVKEKFVEGKLFKTELNNALVNHNANIKNFKKIYALVINEKIYLNYLTSLPLEQILDEKFSPIPLILLSENSNNKVILYDSIADFQKLKVRELLINQQIKTELLKYTPTVGFQGFLGANQFSKTFEPFLSNSWFGSSYIGLSVKLPILSSEKSINGGKQLRTQAQIVNNQKEELVSEKNRDFLQKNIEIERLQAEISVLDNSIILQSENVTLYQERLLTGQLTAIELNLQEAELQKLSSQLKQLQEQLNKAIIERLYISGRLNYKIKLL